MESAELVTVITGAATAMTAAIGILWKTVMELSRKQVEMSKELGKLEGRQEGIRQLSERVLDAVERNRSVAEHVWQQKTQHDNSRSNQ